MTTDLLQESKEAFHAQLEGCFSKTDSSAPLQKLQAKAWAHYMATGLPTKHTEVYRYIRLRQLFSQRHFEAALSDVSPEAIAPAIFPECAHSVLVFVNGYYAPALSKTTAIPKKAVLCSLDDAIGTYGTLLNNQWSKLIKEEKDPFAILNAALHRQGVFLYVPPKTFVGSPIQLLHVTDTKNVPMMLQPRLQLFVGAQSQISIVSTQLLLSGEQYFYNQVEEFSLEEEAHVSYTQETYHISQEAWHFDALRANLKKNSTLKTVSLTRGSATVRNDYRVALAGENAEASLNGIWTLSEKNEAHTNVLIDHQAPHCRSMQLFKGVLNDYSRSSFEGKILVRQAAQKTEAFQLNNNLLLSERANADSKPNLEIFADDVKASHGATVGQLDQEQMFYLKARGFSDSAAQNILVSSFCKEVFDKVTIPSLVHELRK